MNIGIDHGYYAIKTRHFSFPAGIAEYSHEPYTLQNTLEFGGKFYVCGTGRQPILRNKMENDNYYLLMLVLPERERTKKGAIGVETKGVTCKIPLDLHNQISEEIRETESTMSKFIEMIIREHYEKGANRIMEKGRTLAFQVSEELFQRVKEYLENYEKAYHRRLTQKEFVIGLIEQALEEAEEEFEAARAAEHEEQAENGWEAAEIAESDEDEEVSDDEEPEDWDEENGETEGLSADEETTGSSWEPAENTETGEGEEEPSEDDEDTTPESWNQDEEEETEPDDDTIESGETNENEDETYA